MQEVAVIQGLQADVTELQIAVGNQRLGQLGQVVRRQHRIEQVVGDAVGDVLRKIVQIVGRRFCLRHFLAEHFLADRVQQDAGRHLRIRRVFFHQRARRQDGGLVQFFDRHAVVQVAHRLGQDGVGVDVLFQADAGGGDQVADLVHVEQAAHAVFKDMEGGRIAVGGAALRFLGQAALFHVLGTVQHVGARDVVFARAHQRQFHLVLHVFNVEGAAARMTAHQRGHHAGGQLLDQFAHPRRGSALAAGDGKEGLGNGDGDFRRFEGNHGAVAADDAVVAMGGDSGSAAGGSGQAGCELRRMGGNVL